MYESLNYAKETCDHGIVFPPVTFNKASVLVSYSDASWANARCLKSQYGVITVLCPANVTEVTCYGFLLDWRSGRTPRVCRSTLASEACASDEAADRACFANLVLSELLYQKAAFLGDLRLNSFLCTDAKSLYDCLVAENPVLTDKRSMVQVRSVQQSHPPSAIRWVPTKLQFADGLTKLATELRAFFGSWCQGPWSQLQAESTTKTSVKVHFMQSC